RQLRAPAPAGGDRPSARPGGAGPDRVRHRDDELGGSQELLVPAPAVLRRAPQVSRDVTARVSVVVPSYNNAPFIEATMDSILGQTFEDFELVVADHSSTDGTWDRLQRYRADPRVRLLRTSAGGGAPR